jgi:hypothetical protein
MHRALLLALVLSVVPSTLRAQEIQLSGPLACAPAAVYRRSPTLESTQWVAAGFALAGSLEERPMLGLGADATFWLARGLAGDPLELRGGAWVQGTTMLDGGDAAAEGGLELTFGHEHSWTHARGWSFGTFGLRAGGGARVLDGARAAALVTTVTWGLHSFMEPRSIACPFDDPSPRVLGSVVRLFATHRSDADLGRSEWAFGVELTPAVFDAETWER